LVSFFFKYMNNIWFIQISSNSPISRRTNK
jgi:hypothetical protein